MSAFAPVPYCLDYSFVIQYILKSGIVTTPVSVFFFRIALAIRGLFWFPANFRIVCCSSVKNAGVTLIGISICPLSLVYFLYPKKHFLPKTPCYWLSLFSISGAVRLLLSNNIVVITLGLCLNER